MHVGLMATRLPLAPIAVTALLLTGCSSSTTSNSPSTSPSSTAPSSRKNVSSSGKPNSSSTLTQSPKPKSAAKQAFDSMSLRERVGQLLMVDCPSTGVAGATMAAIRADHVGSVILDGTTQQGMAQTRNVTSELRRLAPAEVGLFVATDQEGGRVQRLEGTGFASIPSAVDQGTKSAGALRRDARAWGSDLHRAGVNLNLAPVLDTVPSSGGANPPIGDLEREYGHSPRIVTSHGLAFARGMLDAGVDPAVKHFPGLGRVSGNTDTTSGVTDSTTSRNDPYLSPFRAAAQAKVPFVMMSTAIYSKIDPGIPAAFSHAIVTDLLRHRFGFRGVIVSDDVGVAKQVALYSPGQRAVKFVQAGGDLVLTVDASQADAMTKALTNKARGDGSFRAEVDAAALRVLQAKQSRGLLG